MTLNSNLSQYFKAETQTAGIKLFKQEKVRIVTHSDIQVQCQIQAFSSVKVLLKSEHIESSIIKASCTCKDGLKMKFCVHIWASLLFLEKINSDFLANKFSLELLEQISKQSPAKIQKNQAANELVKEKARAFRKEQYQKQKMLKKSQKNSEDQSSQIIHPIDIQAALKYFESNGFPMIDGPSEDILTKAKKQLSRIFHPDKGGTHAETIELNQNYDLLLSFIKK